MNLPVSLPAALFAACLSTLAASPAQAVEPKPAPAACENEALMRSLGKLAHGKGMRTARDADGALTLDLVQGATRVPVMRVTCDTIEVPIAAELPQDDKLPATRVLGGLTLARAAGGALSLDFEPLLLDREAVSVVVLFDDSVSLVRGGKVFYALARRADGSTSEIEGVGNGCGCERITTRDGKVELRRLAR